MDFDTMPADTFFMGVAHRALLLDLARVVEAVWSTPDDERRRLVAERAEFLMEFLHFHHSVEDEHLWPLLRGRSSELDSMTDELDADHRRIEKAVPAVVEAAQAYAHEPDAGFALVDAIRRLRGVLDGHLHREEAVVLPFASQIMSQAEWMVFGEKARPADPATAVSWFAWFLDDLDDNRTAKVQQMLPPPVWQMVTDAIPAHAAAAAARWED